MVSVVRPLIAASFSGLITASVMPADAAKRQPATQPVVERSASGTIIRPTTTIVPNGAGGTRTIVIPRRRSCPTGSTAGTIKGPVTIHCRGVAARRRTQVIRARL